MTLDKLPSTISISAKCSDRFHASFLDEKDTVVADYTGYVPDFFPDDHFGDYIMLDIDLQTGQIRNWVPPTLEQINKLKLKR